MLYQEKSGNPAVNYGLNNLIKSIVHRRQLSGLQAENSELASQVQSLSHKLEAQSDYTSIKKDLAILKVQSLHLQLQHWRCSMYVPKLKYFFKEDKYFS
jgi:hypothetical protein